MSNPNIVSAVAAALSNAQQHIFKVPATEYGGPISIQAINAYLNAGTVSVSVLDMGTGGTAVSGTLATYAGTLAAAANCEFTISDATVEAGHWIALQENNVAAVTGEVSLQYVFGK